MDKSALYNLSYGVYIVSAKDGGRDVGCVANTVFQVTSSPSTLGVSINKDNYTNPCILKTGKFAVSILSERADNNLIGTFGFSSSKDNDKFENFEHITTDNGLAVVTSGVCGYIEYKVINTLDCFTHTIIIGEIIGAENLANEPPMTYAYYHNVIKGKAPKNAPTYVPPDEAGDKAPDKSGYICSVCGYKYEGSDEEFEALPNTYTCPICSAPKEMFVKG